MEYQQGLFDAPIYSPDCYHNTVGLSGQELKDREMRADAQGRRILTYFRQHPDESFTPYQIMDALNYGPFQLQSVRRSLTNLTQCIEHYLRMTGVKTMERSGDLNNRWCLNHAADQRCFKMTLKQRQKKFVNNSANK